MGAKPTKAAAPDGRKYSPAWDDPPPHVRPTGKDRCKFAVWAASALLIVAVVVGLSVSMAVFSDGSSSSSGGGGGSGGGLANPLAPIVLPTEQPPFPVPQGYTVLWWDEFNGNSIDKSKWGFDLGGVSPTGGWGWGNGELQSYTDQAANARVEGGNLIITALRQKKGKSEYTSARLTTQSTAAFWPGMRSTTGQVFTQVHVEARIKLPTPGQGLWPAFWMLPSKDWYGRWASSGEIDVAESRNDMTGITQGVHFGGPAPQNQQTTVPAAPTNGQPNWSTQFYTFGVDWSLDGLQFTVDSQAKVMYRNKALDPASGWFSASPGAPVTAPFDKPFYLILNLAVGGLFTMGGPTDFTSFPAQMLVDYVRVYAK